MKVFVAIGDTDVWLDPASIVAIFEGPGGSANVLLAGIASPLTISGASVDDVLEAVGKPVDS